MSDTPYFSQVWPSLIALITARVIENAFPDINYSVAATAFLVLVVWLCYLQRWFGLLLFWRGTNDAGFNTRLKHAFSLASLMMLLFFATLFGVLVSREWNGVVMSTHTLLVYVAVTASVIAVLTCDAIDAARPFTPPA